MTTTEEAPEGAVGAGGEDGALASHFPAEVELQAAVVSVLRRLWALGASVERWHAAGFPTRGLSPDGPNTPVAELLRVVSWLRTAPGALWAPDAADRLAGVMMVVMGDVVPAAPPVGGRPDPQPILADLAVDLLNIWRRRELEDQPELNPAFGIANDWGELHDLVVARVRRQPDDAGPFLADLSECWLAEELLRRAETWEKQGRVPPPDADDAACVARLCMWLWALPEPAAEGEARPTLDPDVALGLLLTCPVEVCLEAEAARTRQAETDQPADLPASAPSP